MIEEMAEQAGSRVDRFLGRKKKYRGHARASFVKTVESNFEHEDCKKCCLKQFP